MNEVTDPQTLDRLRSQILSIPIYPSPHVRTVLHRAWEDTRNHEDGNEQWYYVDLSLNVQIGLSGMLDAQRGALYLDVRSMLVLINNCIEERLAAYNAGHSPYYRGM